MSKARQLADLLDASGDVSVDALDNVPPSNDASALTTGTLPVDRVPYVGRRNLIINGAMQVWQRGISWASLGNGIYTADRWQSFGSGLTCVIDRSTDVPANQGFRYSFKVNRTANGLPILRQPIEDFDILVTNRQVTLSFWAKADTATTVDVDLGDNDSAKATFSLTTTWQYFTHTYDATSAYTFSALDFQANSVTTAMYFTGIQLEHGSVATPFEHRSYGEELALCQRYFCKNNPQSEGLPALTGSDIYYHTTGSMCVDVEDFSPCSVMFPVTMRATPTVVCSHLKSYNGSLYKEVTGASALDSGIRYLTHNAGNTGTTYQLGRAYKFAWYADAEL